jgi:flagellar biosynthesis protein FliR
VVVRGGHSHKWWWYVCRVIACLYTAPHKSVQFSLDSEAPA